MIEIFKTTIDNAADAEKIRRLILDHFPGCLINIDLEDCDNVLRINGKVCRETIITLVNKCNYQCEVLE